VIRKVGPDIGESNRPDLLCGFPAAVTRSGAHRLHLRSSHGCPKRDADVLLSDNRMSVDGDIQCQRFPRFSCSSAAPPARSEARPAGREIWQSALCGPSRRRRGRRCRRGLSAGREGDRTSARWRSAVRIATRFLVRHRLLTAQHRTAIMAAAKAASPARAGSPTAAKADTMPPTPAAERMVLTAGVAFARTDCRSRSSRSHLSPVLYGQQPWCARTT
jgi:hypothetical protein